MKKFFLMGCVLIISLGFFGCSDGGSSEPAWWQGRYDMHYFNDVELPPGSHIIINTTGLTAVYAGPPPETYRVRGNVSTRPRGNVLYDGDRVGYWVDIFGNGTRIGIAINVTEDTPIGKGQVLALGIKGLTQLTSDFYDHGFSSDVDNSSTWYYDPYAEGFGYFWIYSNRWEGGP